MKRKCYIAFIAFAIAVLLTAVFLPHHHHNGMLCSTVEYCEDDNKFNDEHTGHSSSDQSKCLEHSDFLLSKRTFNDIDASVNLLPIFIFAEQFILFPDLYLKDSHIKYFYRQSLYKSADIGPTNTLRGPPCSFV